MKKIFILGASALQIPMIRLAKEKGLYVYVLDYDAHAAGIPLADEFLCISTIDTVAVMEAAGKYKPDYVMTSTSDMPVRTVSWVCEQLGLKSDIAYEDALCATDKNRMRRRMKERGVPIPKFYAAYSVEDFIGKSRIFKDRFVAKPADNAASRGVVLVDTHKNSSVQYLKEIYAYVHSFSRNGVVMVEEYMDGPEVSVETFTVDGEPHIITITDKMVTDLPYFVETGHTQMSRLPEIEQQDIRRVAMKAVKAINMQNGPCHVEIKATSKGAKLVEIAARMGGDYITSMLVPLSTGVDMTGLCLSSVMGEPVDLTPKYARGSAVRFIYMPDDAAEGRSSVSIKSIEGLEAASAMPGIKEVRMYKGEGDEAGPLKSSNDRLGHIIAEGADADEAAARADAALSTVRITYG